MYNTILVPIDGSDPANRATEYALELARHFDSTIHALYVVDTSRYGEPALSSTELVLTELEDRGQELLAEFTDRADNEDITVESHVCHGSPHVEILDYADRVDAEVIVLGYQGHSHKVADHIGSVSERVVRSGDRPVLTV